MKSSLDAFPVNCARSHYIQITRKNNSAAQAAINWRRLLGDDYARLTSSSRPDWSALSDKASLCQILQIDRDLLLANRGVIRKLLIMEKEYLIASKLEAASPLEH